MAWIKAMKGRRPHASGRPTRARHLQVLFGVLTGLLVTATVLFNVVMVQLGERYGLTVDLTANAAFEVGPETQSVLQRLDRDVAIFVLATEDAFGGNTYFAQAQRIIEQYPLQSSRVTLSYVDYAFDPTFASRYPDLALSEGDVLVTSGDRVKQLQLSDLFNYDYTEGGGLRIQSSRAEEALTSSILYVLSDEQVRVAVLEGNGMADMDAFTELLADNNYDVTPVNLTTGELGDDYDLALLLGPRIDLSEAALSKLDAFLYNDSRYGKTLFYTADVAQETLPNLEVFFSEWGIVIDDGVVFETTAERTFQYQPYYPVADYVDEDYRDRLLDPSAPVLMPLARPLTLVYETRDNNTNEVLLQFSETSGVRPAEAADSFSVDQAERWGPMPALVLAGKRIYGTTGFVEASSHLVFSASTAMLDAPSIQSTSLANSEYLLNLLNDLCERTDVVAIPPKSLGGNALAITTAQSSTLGILLAGVLPLGTLATGIVIWLVRRYQ
ncbi:MAG: GldG family protein [Anaerolineae bacterium]|nr:GldG family protein [Anaerolineae bacterium]